VIAFTPNGRIAEGVNGIYSGLNLGFLCLQYDHNPQDHQLLNIALVIRESCSIPGAYERVSIALESDATWKTSLSGKDLSKGSLNSCKLRI